MERILKLGFVNGILFPQEGKRRGKPRSAERHGGAWDSEKQVEYTAANGRVEETSPGRGGARFGDGCRFLRVFSHVYDRFFLKRRTEKAGFRPVFLRPAPT